MGTKQKWDVITNYRGYQTMDSRDHPDVTRGQKANDLISDIKYKADYEDSKVVLCFPYTLTDQYDTTQSMQKLKYGYTQEHERTKAMNRYDVTNTPTYAQMKEHEERTSDIKYKGDFENNKGKMLGTEETPEMARAKDLLPISSKHAYESAAKAALAKHHVTAEDQQIAHAANMTVQASDLQYKADYKKDQLGKGVADPAIAYPEHDRLKKIKDSTKKSNYEKESKEIMKKNIYPPDAPEFLRAIESAKNASDKEYQKQKWDVIIKYRGYQTMDSRDHPDVTRGQKANDLISEIKYRADYEDSKVVLCFPYTLTDQYDTTQAMQKLKYDYVQDYQKSKTNNHYDVTDTPSYTEMKLHNEHTSEVKYKEAYENNKGKMLGTEETPEMSLAMELKPFQSKQAYEGAAKAALIKHHVDGDDQKIAHAQNMTVQASDLQYKADYKNELVGKGVADPAIAYPEHDRLKKIAEETKTSNYQKEARAVMKKNIYPPDAPEFLRATESAKNASDWVYKKQRDEVIANYRGYQTMDSRVHPDVVRGQKANDLISDIKYKEDYEDSKVVLCFPYTLTDQYDTTQQMQKLKHDYVLDHEKTKVKNNYNVAETQEYTQLKEHHEMTCDINYKEQYKKSKGKMLGTEETPEMSLAMELKPFQSKQAYEGAAKAALMKHHVDAEGAEISHAVDMSIQASNLHYKALYKDEVLGKSVNDPAIAYPEHERLKKILEDTKKSNYQKEASEVMKKNIY